MTQEHYSIGNNDNGTYYVNHYITRDDDMTRRDTIADELSERDAMALADRLTELQSAVSSLAERFAGHWVNGRVEIGVDVTPAHLV